MNRVTLENGKRGRVWCFDSAPDIRMRLRRLFASAKAAGQLIRIDDTPANAEDVEWILHRYPHDIDRHVWQYLTAQAEIAKSRRLVSENAMAAEHTQPPGLALPLRQYQLQAVEIAFQNRGLLCGDDLGLGKTAVGIGLLAMPGTLPAVVVTPTHLTNQWVEQLARFLPGLKSYVIKKTNPEKETVPKHHVTVIPYSRLAGWRDHLPRATVIFDEVHALRHTGTNKWNAAKQVADAATWRLGLSATPVFNYGDEIHSIMDCLTPGHLGTYGEFTTEWCTWNGRHNVVNDPVALGAHLRQSGNMVRRTREEVGRELPDLLRVQVPIEYDANVIAVLKSKALNLAATVLHGTFVEKGKAARQLDLMLRQATGIAKAPFAAEFVADLVGNGRQVVVGAWHREVYAVLESILEEKGITSVKYTGSESPAAKQRAKDSFVGGHAQVFLISLRSGEGLDGLQGMSNTVVIAELDWSPQAINQLIGRVHRDGQQEQCTAFYLTIDNGSDPVVAGVLGLKGAQADGIVDMKEETVRPADEAGRAAMLAASILQK